MKLKIGKSVLRINVSFAAIVTLMLILDSSGMCAVALFCCIIHEAGHIVCMLIFGEYPEKLELSFYGMKLERREFSSLSAMEETAVYAAGPMMNFVLSAFLFLFRDFSDEIVTAAVISFCMGSFNLLPCTPLDGGNIMYHILSSVASQEKAEGISFCISCITLVPMTVTGVIILLKGGNPTLIAVTAYLAVVCYTEYKT